MSELYHFNPNHDPITGRFTSGSGSSRYYTKDGSLTPAGQRKTVNQINSIYRHLDKKQKQFVTDEDVAPKRFTDVDEHTNYALKSFIAYDKKKPVSTVTAWKQREGEAAISIMTRKDYQGKGYGSNLVREGMQWLETSGIKRVYWGANIHNNPSIELAKAAGFKYMKMANYNDRMSVIYVKDL